MDIKPTKLIKGQGMEKILSKSNCQALGINLLTEEDEEGTQQPLIKISIQKIHIKYETYVSYRDAIHYLLFLRCSMNMDKFTYRELRLEAQKFIISNGKLYLKYLVGILLLFLVETETQRVTDDLYSADCGGHYN